MAKHTHGAVVRYCHEGEDHRAQVTDVHPETGEVLGLAVYNADGVIIAGAANPKPVTAKEHRISDGYFWS
jgi:hypothetical protein